MRTVRTGSYAPGIVNFLMFVQQELYSTITGCSCVLSMDFTVCHKQIAEEWRQQIFVVGKHKFSSMERIDLENI